MITHEFRVAFVKRVILDRWESPETEAYLNLITSLLYKKKIGDTFERLRISIGNTDPFIGTPAADYVFERLSIQLDESNNKLFMECENGRFDITVEPGKSITLSIPPGTISGRGFSDRRTLTTFITGIEIQLTDDVFHASKRVGGDGIKISVLPPGEDVSETEVTAEYIWTERGR